VRIYMTVACCTLLGLAVGCAVPAQQRVAAFISPAIRSDTLSRIIVVPFDGLSCTAETRKVVTESVALELMSVLLCDVIPAPADDERLMAEIGLWRRGRIDVDTLVMAQKTYGADAFLFGTITQCKEYDPPLIGLKLRMLSASTGDVLWATEAVFDARNADVRRRARASFKSSGLKDMLYGPDLVLMSPRLFSRFVAQEVIRPLRTHLAKSTRPTVAGK